MPMFPDATIRMLLEDFHWNVLPNIAENLIARDLSLGTPFKPAIGNMAKVITGMRRCGKTFRLYQQILELLDQGVSASHICYFNFDDDRVRPYADGLIGHVLEVFFELHPESRREGAYVFFDEIQDVDDWGIAARRIIDTEKVTLYMTGSSSRLLSEDIATEFRGRSIAYELSPFSFREMLRVQGVEVADGVSLNDKELSSVLKKAFRSYLIQGGFPAVRVLDDLERTQVLQDYVQMTVSRDVVERMNFSNASYARTLARAAVTSSARDVSINRLDHKGKSSGYSPGREKIAALLDAFDSAHLVYQVFEFSYSVQKVRTGGMKLYAVDPGLYWALSSASNDGLTFALETVVYLELRRRRATNRLGEVSMLKLHSGREVDFVMGDATADEATMLMQVCFDLSDEATAQREFKALEEAMTRFNLKDGYIVTMDEEYDVENAVGAIHVVPAWKWLLP